MKALISTFAVASLLALAAPVLAEESAPMLTCHTPAAGERATAVAKMNGTDVMLACVPTQMMMAPAMRTIGKVAAKTRAYGPNIDGLLTPAQIDAAWKKWTDMTFNIPPTTP